MRHTSPGRPSGEGGDADVGTLGADPPPPAELGQNPFANPVGLLEVRLAGPLGSRVLTVNGRQVPAQAIDDPLPFSPATTVTARR